jgi:peptidoglycan-associated lipoprotein
MTQTRMFPLNASVRALALTAVSAAALLMTGCGSTVKLDDQANNGPAPITTATPSNGANANGLNNGNMSATAVTPVVVAPADSAADASGLTRVIYFDFDSFVVKDEFRGAVDAPAKRLTAAKTKKVIIEGHTDERGGHEYNLALGQKRAEAVQKSLTLLGVSADQIEAVSFGEERPVVQGANEEAWAKNRRAEIKDR